MSTAQNNQAHYLARINALLPQKQYKAEIGTPASFSPQDLTASTDTYIVVHKWGAIRFQGGHYLHTIGLNFSFTESEMRRAWVYCKKHIYKSRPTGTSVKAGDFIELTEGAGSTSKVTIFKIVKGADGNLMGWDISRPEGECAFHAPNVFIGAKKKIAMLRPMDISPTYFYKLYSL